MAGDLIQTPHTRWKIGSYESVNKPTVITLIGRVANGAAETRFSRLIVPGIAGGYSVTAGKTLYITHIHARGTVAALLWHLGSATADPGDNQVATPTGAISLTAIDSTGTSPHGLLVANQSYEFEDHIPVPANLFPYVRCSTSSASFLIIIKGHEE